MTGGSSREDRSQLPALTFAIPLVVPSQEPVPIGALVAVLRSVLVLVASVTIPIPALAPRVVRVMVLPVVTALVEAVPIAAIEAWVVTVPAAVLRIAALRVTVLRVDGAVLVDPSGRSRCVAR